MTKRIISGITPSGNELHIGNYYGAVKPQIELQSQSDYQTLYFIADLHALTTVKDAKQLSENINSIILDYLALGLDPEKTIFFRQSDVSEHAQLAVILANYVSYAHMQRMHAFKDKLQKNESVENINMGLFNYPILMASDILLYKPYGVPVGEDQRQHIEITRDIAESFNKTYQQTCFPLPEPIIHQQRGKIVGTDGQRKMSKSLGNIISIFQDEDTIKTQIMNCFTDPNRIKATDPGKVEGNPIFIYHDLINQDAHQVAELKQRYQAGTVGDVEVKQALIQAHQALFAPMRHKRQQLAQNSERISQILAQGSSQAKQIAHQTLSEVQHILGL